jgi:hypothetical protein
MQKKLVQSPWIILLLFITLAGPGCFTYRISTKAGPGTEYSKPKTIHNFFWGALQKPTGGLGTPLCDSLQVNGVSEVKVKTNIAYAAVTVLSLGIWCPLRVQYKCSKPCQVVDRL